MQKKTYQFSSKKTDLYFDADFSYLSKLTAQDQTVLVTDENIFSKHARKFKGWNTIVLKPGEEYKVQATASAVIGQLIEYGADRKTTLIGIGGGVVTDLTGYVAAVYMRGIRFGFVPTSILAMVDASIGGKNGIDVGVYKNLVGTIRQPDFLLYDFSFLRTLPETEWINGFAEVIKHSCIRDAALFRELESNKLRTYRKDITALAKLIRRNASIKCAVVEKDEFEQGDRRLLNFGHTLGHAIENLYALTHGQAVSVGMVAACAISEQLAGFKETARVVKVLDQYGLPTLVKYDKAAAFEILKMDKKKEKQSMNYVLLSKIGKGLVQNIPLPELETIIKAI
ncbi:MAG: 3-dehydroquinate synthase [Candidatus Pseudobacter hemicellulosilyticus]|uniref:3-dehydroquinate synthase n=1 Tax=Candidatus Pseudobacter hemicellulosilyticus TaxID=3121375 RepID=A0AAJ5WQ96_9BACT|nr:MAG: 3-dehydroquinate synthase [Pseudobacter sp.]